VSQRGLYPQRSTGRTDENQQHFPLSHGRRLGRTKCGYRSENNRCQRYFKEYKIFFSLVLGSIVNQLKPMAEELLAEERAGFKAGKFNMGDFTENTSGIFGRTASTSR